MEDIFTIIITIACIVVACTKVARKQAAKMMPEPDADDEAFNEEQTFEEYDFDESSENTSAAAPQSGYFSYEYDMPDAAQSAPKQAKAKPAAKDSVKPMPAEEEAVPGFNFNLRDAVIYQAVMNNEYVSGIE